MHDDSEPFNTREFWIGFGMGVFCTLGLLVALVAGTFAGPG